MIQATEEARNQIVATVRDFVKREVTPHAAEFDENDTYPQDMVEQMKTLGLFGIAIPEEYGGLGLDYTTFAMIFEELAKGWMSITGPVGTHSRLKFLGGVTRVSKTFVFLGAIALTCVIGPFGTL